MKGTVRIMSYSPTLESALDHLRSFEVNIHNKYKRTFKGQLKTRIDPEDVIQSTAARVIRLFDSCQAQNDFQLKGWVWRAVGSEISDLTNYQFTGKRSIRRQSFSFDAEPDSTQNEREAAIEPEAELEVLKTEQLEVIREAIEELKHSSERQAAVVEMCYFEGKDNAEIAKVLGVSEGAVRTLKSRGLEKIREYWLVAEMAEDDEPFILGPNDGRPTITIDVPCRRGPFRFRRFIDPRVPYEPSVEPPQKPDDQSGE